MNRLLAAAALALALAPAAALAAGAAATDLSGAWKINGAFGEAIQYSVTCTLKQDGASLSGPCTDPQGGHDVQATGKVDGQSVEIAYDTTYQGGPVHLDYKGDLQPDGSLKGVVDAGGPEGTFTASRQ